MKTLKDSRTASFSLPVSKKAYTGFVDRIRQVYAFDISRSDAMIDVLDRYLGGDSNAADSLDESMRMAFEFLRHEVDLAVTRSRRARDRARLRREAASGSMDQATFEAQLDERLQKIFRIVDDEEAVDIDEPQLFSPLTRRERRARERAARGKSRYKRLGQCSGVRV